MIVIACMTLRDLAGVLKTSVKRDAVASRLASHEDSYDIDNGDDGDRTARQALYASITANYYDLVTDLYVYGWGQSFHFAPRAPAESFSASIARHQHYIAHALGLHPGMRVADFGCGVGGPLREIARFSGAEIVGVNISAYQIELARKQTSDAGLAHLASFVEADFTDTGLPEGTFDAIYAIEATCHAADRSDVFAEALRLLRPGGLFASYEWCMTDAYNPIDPEHRRLKRDIELGDATQDLISTHDVEAMLQKSGFDLLDARDLAVSSGPAIPWYQPLVGSRLSVANFRSSSIGRWATHQVLRAFQAIRVVPQGTPGVARLLNVAADALVQAGRAEIFTPMYFVLGRKPLARQDPSCDSAL